MRWTLVLSMTSEQFIAVLINDVLHYSNIAHVGDTMCEVPIEELMNVVHGRSDMAMSKYEGEPAHYAEPSVNHPDCIYVGCQRFEKRMLLSMYRGLTGKESV